MFVSDKKVFVFVLVFFSFWSPQIHFSWFFLLLFLPSSLSLFSVPQFKVYDDEDETVYIVKPPTCCCGLCIDFCTEEKCCPHGCLMLPFRIYEAGADTNGDAPFVGKMIKIPKETFSDTFNETSFVELQFPKDADAQKKGLLLGAYLLINSLFFENSE